MSSKNKIRIKWIDISFIYLNYTSPDTVKALFNISVCCMHFTTKYADLNVKLREPNLSSSGKAFGIPLKMGSK